MYLITLVLMTLTLALLQRQIRHKLTAVVLAMCLFFSLLLACVHFFSDTLTGAGIDESVFFHLKFGLKGAGLTEFYDIILYSIITFSLILGLSILAYYKFQCKRGAQSNKIRSILGIIVLFIAITMNPGVHNVVALVTSYTHAVENIILPKEYKEVGKNDSIRDKKNVVFIYFESLERTYLDEKLFPDLMPNLKRIERNALNFTGVNQIIGSGWTIAGKVSSQCGIPLFTPSDGNSMSGVNRFLPKAKCLGDVLSTNDYALSYVGGSTLEFAGKGNFYRTHGFQSVSGLDELINQVPSPAYRSAWGLYDDTLVSIFKRKFEELTSSSRPFGLFALTLDTHHPRGHLSKFCEGIEYLDGKNPMLNALRCADKLVYEIYNFITTHERFDNTILVISSDHLAMPNTAFDVLKKGDRKNLFLIIGPNISPVTVERSAALIDVAPTILSVLGLEVEGFGFGRSLLTNESTLMEQFGSKEKLNEFFAKHRKNILKLWDFPQLDSGLYIAAPDNFAHLGNDTVGLPAILLLSDQAEVQEVRFEFSSPITLSEQIFQLKPGQKFLWIDTCHQMGWLINQDYSGLGSNNCITIASLDTVMPWYHEIKANYSVSKNLILEIINSQTHANNSAESKRESHAKQKQDARVVEIRSAGGFSGVSQVKSEDTINLLRGMTLVGLGFNGKPKKIAHYDTCGDGAIVDSVGVDGNFQNHITEASDKFNLFALISHDSVVCSNLDLSQMFEGIELHELGDIQMREPYIGLVYNNGLVEEYVGSAGESIKISVDLGLERYGYE